LVYYYGFYYVNPRLNKCFKDKRRRCFNTFGFDNDGIDEIVVQGEATIDYGISIYKISSSKLIEIASWS